MRGAPTSQCHLPSHTSVFRDLHPEIRKNIYRLGLIDLNNIAVEAEDEADREDEDDRYEGDSIKLIDSHWSTAGSPTSHIQ